MRQFDVIVVGAGIEGSATAYHLAKRGKKTLLLEQFPLPHSRGSSHGQSRNTRKAYGAKDFYTKMMADAYKQMDELQEECGDRLFINCGCLIIGHKDSQFVHETESSLIRHGVSHRKWSPVTNPHVFPQFRYSDENTAFILDHSGGLLKADKMLMAYQQLFRKYGGVLNDGESVTEIVPGTTVTVVTDKGKYSGTSVVLSMGPWAKTFLPKMGINVPLKVCLHTGPEVMPESRDAASSDWAIQRVKDWVARHAPTLDSDPSIIETCIYTMTPDQDFILDLHPQWKNIVIGAGFSGHGFKLSPVVGSILADLAMNQTPKFDLTPFRISRFLKNKL